MQVSLHNLANWRRPFFNFTHKWNCWSDWYFCNKCCQLLIHRGHFLIFIYLDLVHLFNLSNVSYHIHWEKRVSKKNSSRQSKLLHVGTVRITSSVWNPIAYRSAIYVMVSWIAHMEKMKDNVKVMVNVNHIVKAYFGVLWSNFVYH